MSPRKLLVGTFAARAAFIAFPVTAQHAK